MPILEQDSAREDLGKQFVTTRRNAQLNSDIRCQIDLRRTPPGRVRLFEPEPQEAHLDEPVQVECSQLAGDTGG
jgi:hypothetical protein